MGFNFTYVYFQLTLGESLGFGSPAEGKWALEIMYETQNQSFNEPAFITIYFNLTGEIDPSTSPSALDLASRIIPEMRFPVNLEPPQTWKLINWVFVSNFWLTLYDVGQINSTLYRLFGHYYVLDNGEYLDLSSPVAHESRNNIFVNNELFQIYSTYLREVIIPAIGPFSYPHDNVPEFMPLDETNRLYPTDTQLYRTYMCSRRQLKGWFSVLVSILAADYALLAALYTFAIYILGWLHKRKEKYKSGLITANSQG